MLKHGYFMELVLLGLVHQEIKFDASLQAFSDFCAFPSYKSSMTNWINKHLLSSNYVPGIYLTFY